MDNLAALLGLVPPPANVKPLPVDVVDMVQRRILNTNLKANLLYLFLSEAQNIVNYEFYTQRRLPGVWWDGRFDL